MSVEQMSKVWKLDLAPNHKIVLLALADHADDDGGNVYPSVERVAWKTGYVVRQVQNIMRDLRAAGLIEAVANAEGGRGKVARYQLHLDKGENLAPFVSQSQAKDAKSDTHSTQSATTKDEPQFTRTISETPDEPSVRDSVPHGTARMVALEKLPTPYEVLDQGCQVLGIEAKSYGGDLPKQLEVVRRMLAKGHTEANILGCLGWLASDEWQLRKGIDWFKVEDHMARFISTTGTPTRAAPPKISDIRNPRIKAAFTTDLSDITAEYEARRAERNGLPRQVDHAQLPAAARRVGPGGAG